MYGPGVSLSLQTQRPAFFQVLEPGGEREVLAEVDRVVALQSGDPS